jgi:NADPH:quinone reductase
VDDVRATGPQWREARPGGGYVTEEAARNPPDRRRRSACLPGRAGGACCWGDAACQRALKPFVDARQRAAERIVLWFAPRSGMVALRLRNLVTSPMGLPLMAGLVAAAVRRSDSSWRGSTDPIGRPSFSRGRSMPDAPETMPAVRLGRHGGPEVLELARVPLPEPAAHQALVRVEVAGLNFIDVYKREGRYPVPLPATLGEEGAGVVVRVGAEVTQVRVGDRVAWAGVFGSFAQYAAVPAARLVPLPARVSTSQGAAVMLQGMTAHYLATSTCPLRTGDRCLVHAGAGGTGLLLTQIAKRRGAFVITTVGSDEKAALSRAAGADEVIVYTREDFGEAVHRITGGRGVQVIYDSVGKTTFLPGLELLAPRGMMVLFGASSGAVDPIDPQLLNRKGSLYLTRPTLTNYTATREELLGRAGELFAWIASGQLEVRVGAEYPLAEVRTAYRALEGRQTTGKVLLRID